ncbi:hypothetical protein ERX37_09170 [Macrococcus hajekii]|uniref:Uncharacterized protein n=1 Tax=Macrococcus hajekii TaxID=198482 RepID=A0A4R6BIB6_9STAP|nr:hypothetical protein [Macrococcus hajekii]TDM01276.1 hypothetical protein ERX37_09170 [Macrococcus hajekii]GGB10266.1 transport permease protein [Macrococcus hajekii]
MNELTTYIPYIVKNTIIDLRYNLKQYIWWLLVNIVIIFFTFFLMNLMTTTGNNKSRLLFQLSGYLLFFWVAGSLFYSSSLLSRRGFILNITHLPLHVLVNVHIVNFLLQFIVSFAFLVFVAYTNHIPANMSVTGMLYFMILTYLLLIPVGILLSLIEYYSRNMKRNVIIFLILLLISVSILWVPARLPELLIKVLSLNPFYFLINGFQTATVEGTSAFYNIPLHLLFYCELVLMYIWTFYFYKKLKDEINRQS